MDFVPYAVPFFVLLMGLELLWGWHKGRNTYRVNDTVSSLFMGSLSTTTKLVILGIGGWVFTRVEAQYALTTLDPASVWTWLLALLLYDFCYYWAHRIGHERTLFWASHVAHHQSEEFNLSTALRQTSTSFLVGWIFYVPMFALGVPASVFISVASVHLIYQFWIHTEHIPKLGPLEWVFVTASNHRVHHAQNDIYVDRNYGGLLIVWDRLFGTFQEEMDDEPAVYGILGPLRSWNPVRANLHIYAGMLSDCWRTRSWGDKCRIWLSRTGWRPDDVTRSHPRVKSDLNNFHKYDPTVDPWVKAYALLQLVVCTSTGSILIMIPASNYAFNLVAVGLMLVTMVMTSRWLEGAQGNLFWELLRLVMFSCIAIGALAMDVYTKPALMLLTYSLINGFYLLVVSRMGSKSAVVPSIST